MNGWAGRNPTFDFLMIWVSAAGVPLLVLAVAGQWWLRTDKPHTRHVLLAAGFSFLLGLAINQLVLLFIHRVRPYDSGVTNLLIARSGDFSFPSDHATATFAIAAAFLLHGMRRRGLGFLAAALLIAISRVYVGTHYASDVLGGALTGIIAAVVIRSVYQEGTRTDRFHHRHFISAGVRLPVANVDSRSGDRSACLWKGETACSRFSAKN
jgi:undecaprenyl-diphosphatase